MRIDSNRGKKLAKKLYNCFSTTGIFGNTEMPEDLLPIGVDKGSIEHLLFITLSVSIDYQRDANIMWAASRKTYEDSETRYLFDPGSLHSSQPKTIEQGMFKYRLSKKYKKDAHIWRTVGVSFLKKYDGNPLNFLEDCDWDSLVVLKRLKNDKHIYNRKEVPDFPYLRGNKIGPLWLRMLRDNIGITELKNLDQVPIPVDIHVARSTLAVGVVTGTFQGKIDEIFNLVRKAWFESVQGLSIKNRPMIALDVDEPLWHLSKYGCTKRDKITGECVKIENCEAKQYCIPGSINITKNYVELIT